MDTNEINQRISKSKSTMASLKGQGDQMRDEGVTVFQMECIRIIDTLQTEKAQLQGRINELEKNAPKKAELIPKTK